ncbi:MAG: SDR family oxidoreductase [Deltaproteobacteria bacterium]|nr:SDR family oxidoreductase [Deltaproteobacteria bacterium]
MAHAADLFGLKNKVAVVTGGSRGLGYFAAEGFLEMGAAVVICGRDEVTLAQAAKQLEATGGECVALRCDVSDEADVSRMAAQVEERFGRCDVLLNSAGIGGITPTAQVTVESWDLMMAINLRGSFLCCREFGRRMVEQSSGSIINVSSENGQVGFAAGMAPYATTKIGLIGLTRSLAVEWGRHNVRVNAVLPGNMQEGMMQDLQDRESPLYQFMGDAMLDMIPLRSFGTGDDMKGACIFLASDAGRYVSGAMIVVDGGFTINAGL